MAKTKFDKALYREIVKRRLDEFKAGHPVVMALNTVGLTDREIGELIGKSTSSIFGYRTGGYVPDEVSSILYNLAEEMFTHVDGMRKRAKSDSDKYALSVFTDALDL